VSFQGVVSGLFFGPELGQGEEESGEDEPFGGLFPLEDALDPGVAVADQDRHATGQGSTIQYSRRPKARYSSRLTW
jgi:hypothetical protein